MRGPFWEGAGSSRAPGWRGRGGKGEEEVSRRREREPESSSQMKSLVVPSPIGRRMLLAVHEPLAAFPEPPRSHSASAQTAKPVSGRDGEAQSCTS